MRKLVSTCCMVLVISVLLTGCKSKPTTKTSISVVTSYGLIDIAEPYKYSLLQEFDLAHENIIVQHKSSNADDIWKSFIRSQFDAGDEPDVLFFFSGTDVKKMIEQGKFVSIDTIRKEYPDYSSNIKEDALESMREFDNQIYAVPVTGFWEGLYCNTNLFEEYDVPKITDWTSLIYAVKTFKANGITPIAASFAEMANYWIEHSILAAGGLDKHAVNPRSIDEIPQEWKTGLSLLKELYDLGAFQSDSLVTRHNFSVNLFNNQEAAMILDGSWMDVVEVMKFKTQVVKFPSLDQVPESQQGVIAGFSSGFYISKKAWDNPAKRDACVQFVKYMTSDSSVGRICNSGAPAANIQKPIGVSKVISDGINLCNTYPTQLPIDSRLESGAWQYFTSMIPQILNNKIEIDMVLKNVVERNTKTD